MALWAALVLAAPVSAAPYSVQGQATVSVTGGGADSDLSEARFVGDSIAVDNGISQASAWYSASLASATLASYAAARADPATDYGSGAHAEVRPVGFADLLSFWIPAGTYATDLRVQFHGFTQGSLSSLGCRGATGNCSGGYQIASFSAGGPLGSDQHYERKDVDAGSNAAAGMNAFFVLDLPLLGATTLAAPRVVDVSVSASLVSVGSALNTYAYLGSTTTMFAGDLWGGFTRLDLPEGLSWSSASGVFLSQPIPEPASALLLLAGLALTGAAVARRS